MALKPLVIGSNTSQEFIFILRAGEIQPERIDLAFKKLRDFNARLIEENFDSKDESQLVVKQ